MSELEKKIDLRVPRLRVSETYKTTGTTDVQWENGFRGKVKFVPWKSFDQTVVETHENINRLKPKRLRFALNNLDILRDFVNGDSFIEEDSSDEDSEGEGVVVELNEGNEMVATNSSITTGNEVLGEGKHDNPNDSPNEIFTDETSTLGVSHYIFMAALSLIRNLRKRKKLYFKCHNFSSEMMCRYDTTGTSLPGLPYPTTVKPDQALVTKKNSQGLQVQPVCTFEFKGPGLKIQACSKSGDEVQNGVQSTVDDLVLDHDVVAPDEGGTSIVGVSEGNFLYTQEDDGGILDDETIPAGSCQKLCEYFNKVFPASSALESKPPSRKIVLALAQTLSQGLLSQSGCCFLFTFQVGIAFEIQPLDATGIVSVAVSRSFRCNEEEGTVAAIVALAMHSLTRIEKEENLKLKIRNCAHVISEAAWTRRNDRDGQKRKKRKRNATATSNLGQTAPGPSNTQNASEAIVEYTDSGDCNPNNDLIIEFSDSSAMESSESSKSVAVDIDIDSNGGKSTETCSIASNDSSGGSLSSFEDMGATETATAMKEIFTSNKGVLGIGSSGVVLRGSYQGEEIAIKTWNRESEEGYKDLRRELEIIKLMEDEFPNLLGYSVPRVLLRTDISNLRFSPQQHEDIVLVTEYVGKGLKRTLSGDLYLIERGRMERVNPREEVEICAAATRSLMSLHESRIIHGDIALPNLRVQKEDYAIDGVSRPVWTAWWIDLGKGTYLPDEHESSDLFTCEKDKCQSLFSL